MGVFCCFMKPKITSWNVRLNEVNKHMHIRNLLKTWMPDIVTLQETKLARLHKSIVQSLWGMQNLDWCNWILEGHQVVF